MNDLPERPVKTPGEWVRYAYAKEDLGVVVQEMCYMLAWRERRIRVATGTWLSGL